MKQDPAWRPTRGLSGRQISPGPTCMGASSCSSGHPLFLSTLLLLYFEPPIFLFPPKSLWSETILWNINLSMPHPRQGEARVLSVVSEPFRLGLCPSSSLLDQSRTPKHHACVLHMHLPKRCPVPCQQLKTPVCPLRPRSHCVCSATPPHVLPDACLSVLYPSVSAFSFISFNSCFLVSCPQKPEVPLGLCYKLFF